MITVLCGGVGGSRFLRGVAAVVPRGELTAIVNTADDEEFHGLYVSPDPDIVTYALAGLVDEERGWGLRGDTFRWIESLARYGRETWFRIGDQDLATHLRRTDLLRGGATLSQVMASIARDFDVDVRLLPMSDDRVRTVVRTQAGELAFQEFLVKRHARDPVIGVRFEGAEVASPAPGVLDAIAGARALLLAPSNPVGSIGPFFAIPGIREAIARLGVPRVAVCPIVAGRSLQPPAAEMLAGLGYAVSAAGVAQFYAGLIDTLVIDREDAGLADEVAALGIRPVVADTIMRDASARSALATTALAAAGTFG